MTSPQFEEQQRFDQWWLWLIVLTATGLMWWGFIQQVILGHPWGTKPPPNWVLWMCAGLFGIGLPILFRSLRLDTQVTEEYVRVRLRPFRWVTFPRDTILTCAARTYRPIREYGGWGIRYGFKRGWAYNVRGNRGVQLTLTNRKPVLIGSQREEELAAAINEARAP